MQKINVSMPKLKKLLELNDRRQQVCYWNFFGIYGDKNVTELREFNKIQYRRGISVKISIVDVQLGDKQAWKNKLCSKNKEVRSTEIIVIKIRRKLKLWRPINKFYPFEFSTNKEVKLKL